MTVNSNSSPCEENPLPPSFSRLFFAKTTRFLADAIFPKTCSVCGRFGDFLCADCARALPRKNIQRCGACGIRETPVGSICPDCRGTVGHDGAFAALRYADPRVARLIHLYKYRFVRSLHVPLGTILAEHVLRSELPLPDALVPIPLHPRRERWRGWNQSELLAQAMLRGFPPELEIPLVNNALIRIRWTTPQMSVRHRTDRAKNIDGAFDFFDSNISNDRHRKTKKKNPRRETSATSSKTTFDFRDKSVWLIDDVAASGSTLSAAARALKASGAKTVYGIVLAR